MWRPSAWRESGLGEQIKPALWPVLLLGSADMLAPHDESRPQKMTKVRPAPAPGSTDGLRAGADALGGMIWHDSQALSHLGQLTSDEMERAVRDTRRATLLSTQAIDLGAPAPLCGPG